jgi:hypothetical protein
VDLGVPLKGYGKVNADTLIAGLKSVPDDFWTADRETRAKLAGNRPGSAVYHYNDFPPSLNRAMPAPEIRNGTVHVLRYPQRALFDEVTRLIEEEIKPHFPSCDTMRTQLAELPPGAVIEPHMDNGVLTLIHRLHVPLITDPGVVFHIGTGAGRFESFHIEAGRLFDLNNVRPHAVVNNSQVRRVHLLVDLLPESIARTVYHDSEDEMLAAATA